MHIIFCRLSSHYHSYKLKKFEEVDHIAWVTYASFGVAAVIDFAIAGAMCYYLRGSRSEFKA